MAVEFEYTGYVIDVPEAEIPQVILDRWKESLIAERDRIKNNLLTKIPNETEFKDKIADASSDAYEQFVNPSFPGADIIKLKQRVKLERAYNKWLTGVQAAFAEGGTFETNVEAKADKFKEVRYTLGAVGFKPTSGYGAIVKAVMFHTGETKVMKYITANDNVTGQPYRTIKESQVKYVKPMIVAKGVYACVLALYANEAGDTTLRDNILSSATTDIEEVINALKRTDVTFSALEYELSWDDAESKIKVYAKAEPA